MRCAHCGTANDSAANFCRGCAKKLRPVCDCWVKKEPYNCGQDQCPGYRLFFTDLVRGDRAASGEVRSHN